MRSELPDIWAIDRSERIQAVYYLREGNLILESEQHNLQGWPAGEAERYTPLLEACYDRGGWFRGLFNGRRLIGIVALDSQFIGAEKNQLQLVFLHVSRPYRHRRLGTHLFREATSRAKEWGAQRLYISATPSQHTIDFYLGLGCSVLANPDPRLFELEPDDIHLGYALSQDS